MKDPFLRHEDKKLFATSGWDDYNESQVLREKRML